jgi:hypothetical protein
MIPTRLSSWTFSDVLKVLELGFWGGKGRFFSDSNMEDKPDPDWNLEMRFSSAWCFFLNSVEQS